MEMDVRHQALVLALGLPSGLVAVTAGGGVTLGVPLLMLAGVPAGASVIAVKVALWAAFLTGSIAHARHQPRLAVPTPWWSWPLCLLGGVCGSRALAALNPQDMRGIVLGMLLVSTIGTVWATRRRKEIVATPTRLQRTAGHAMVFALAVYSGFFGAGYGVFLIWALVALHGHSLASAAALGTRLSLVISTASVAVFVWQGVVPWSIAAPLAAGCAVGGVLGAKAARKLGDTFIRTTTWAVSLLVALKLLLNA